MPGPPKPKRIATDRTSSVPLYRQIAEALRYKIATGEVPIDARLPTITQGSRAWKVNLHTVRRAYAELAADGMVQMQRGRGTIVTARAPATHPTSREGVAAFVDWISSRAASEHGLSRTELADLIALTDAPANTGRGINVIECSAHQAEDLARELSAHWQVKTRGWSLERADEPGAGPFIATYFHYNDIRRRWPHRMKDAAFISIRPSAGLGQQLRSFGRRKGPLEIRLVEREETMASSIASDIKAILPSARYRLERDVAKGRLNDFNFKEGRLYLFSPRLWAALGDAQRSLPNALEVIYEIPDSEQSRLARHFGWARREGED